MRKTKKESEIIKQRIAFSASARLIRRRKRKLMSKRKLIFSRSLSAPREFIRNRGSFSQPVEKLTGKKHSKKKTFLLKQYLPSNLKYLVFDESSPFCLTELKKENLMSNGVIKIPKVFSVIEKPEESYLTLKKIISALMIESGESVYFDYSNCVKVELGSQVLLDIILKDYMKFIDIYPKTLRNNEKLFPSGVGGMGIDNEEVQKLIFSVGSPVELGVRETHYNDIEKYRLCIHDNEKEKNYERRIEQKELDTTELADYVISCLRRMNKELTDDKRDDLCTVIGEILINAEEHSSTRFRFSIGYFKEENKDGNHFGIFRLVILNFGQTIYDKFKSEDCPNKSIVSKMEELSKSYTKRNLFFKKKFEEENLWTLYALQEGITSVSSEDYKRGNGSIRFIESFFNIKGSQEADNVSNMTILSGKTKISFDGKYNILPKINSQGEEFSVMTFNESGNINETPDKEYVYCTENHFPGTMISAKILLNDDDIKQIP